MTVHGGGMGTRGYTGQGREGGTGCEGTEWVSDTSVRCKVGAGLVHQGAWEEGCRWKVVENAQRRLSVEKAMARRRAEAKEGKGTGKAIRTEGMDGRWDAKIASVHMGLASRNGGFALVKRRFA